MKIRRSCLLVAALSFCFLATGQTSKRALVIGLSGVRPDALQAAKTPNIDALVADGAISYKSYTGGLIGTDSEQFTSSGPGWASILTGVWADKHKVANNDFNSPDFVNYPHFFVRLKNADANLKLMSICEWDVLTTNIFENHPDIAAATEYYADAPDGAGVKTLAVDKLANDNPDVLFVEFDGALLEATSTGYSVSNSAYTSAIETIDGYVGELVAAMKARTDYANESWMVMATTDHGGLADGTNGGQSQDEREIFMMVSNDKESIDGIADYLPHTSFPATVAGHLGVAIDPVWGWEGDIFSIEVITPTSFAVFADDIHQEVLFSWVNNSPAGIFNFEIWRDGVLIATLPATATGFVDTDLPAAVIGVAYEIKMVSIDGTSSVYTTTVENYGPVAQYKMEGDVTDFHNNYNGTAEGTVSYIYGLEGDNAASFSNSAVNLGSTLSSDLGTSDFSISLWVQADVSNHDKSLISNKDWSSGANRGWILSTASGRPHFNFTANEGGRIDVKCPEGQIIHDGSWHHVVVTVDRGDMIDIYFDGEKSVSGDITTRTGTVDVGKPVRIAKDGNGGFAFTGNLDDIRIFNYVVDADYVKMLREDAMTPASMEGIGNALDFSNGGTVNFANPIEVAGDWTVEMWLKPTADFIAGTDGQTNSMITTGTPSFRLEQHNDTKKLGCTVTGDYDYEFATATPALNDWTHLAYVRKDNVISLYVDGVKDVNTKEESRNLLINAISGSDKLLAQLDEFRVWSEARSAYEIQGNLDSVDPESENLVAYYKFDQMNDGYLFDHSGNANHGNLTGMTPASDWVDSSLAELEPTINKAILNTKGFSIDWIGFSEKYQVDIATDAAFTSFVPGFESKNVTDTELAVEVPDLNREYFVRVRGINGVDISANSAVREVHPALVGAGESFETGIPSSWKFYDLNGGTAGTWSSVSTTYKTGGDDVPAAPDGTKFAYCRFDDKNPNEDWLVLPAIQISEVGKTVLSFKSCTSTATYYESFKILVSKSTDQMDSSLFTIELANVTFASDLWKLFEYDLGELSDGEIKGGDIVTIAIDYTAIDKRFLVLDQVKVQTVVEAPASALISNVAETSFDISWAAVSGISQYRVDVATDEEFTTFVDGWENSVVADTQTSVTGLVAGTVYYVRVRSEDSAKQLFSLSTEASPVATILSSNKALYIHDGLTDDVVTVGRVPAMEGLSQFTVEMWWKTNADYDDKTRESAFAYRAASNERFLISTGAANPSEKSQVWMTIATGGNDAIGKTPDGALPSTGKGAGQWVHVAAVFDGSKTGNDNRLKIFVNGIKQALTFTGTIPATTTLQAGSMRLGQNNFDASIDEFRFWTVARTDKQVRDNVYKELDIDNDNTGLLVYYDFDIVGGNKLVDKSGNGWHGSLNSTFFGRSWNCWQDSAAINPSSDGSFTSSNNGVVGDSIASTTTASGAEVALAQALNAGENVAFMPIGESDETTDLGDGGVRLARSWYMAVNATNAVLDITFSPDQIGSTLDTSNLSRMVLLYSSDDVNYTELLRYSQSQTRSGDITFTDVPVESGFYTLGNSEGPTPAIGTTFERRITAEGLSLTWSVEEEIGVTSYAVEKKTENGWIRVFHTDNISGGVYAYLDIDGSMDDEYRLVVADNYGLTHYVSVSSPGTVVYYSLDVGWNLLSMPLQDVDLAVVKKQCGAIWTWNGSAYQIADSLVPFAGFWVYSDKKVELEVTGTEIIDSNWSRGIQPGWNLRGPFDNTLIPDWAEAVYSWKKVYNNLLNDSVLMRGIGYWIFVLREHAE